jgi:CysZ protein
MEQPIPERLKTLATPFTRFLDGILFYLRGFAFLARHPKLWPYAILPFLINLLVVAAAAVALFYFLPEIGGLLWKPPTAWYGWLLYVPYVVVLGFLILIVSYILFFMILPGIIAPPFKGKLTRYTREILKETSVHPVGGIYVDVIEPTILEIRKGLRLLLITVVLLPLNLIPLLGNAAYLGIMSYFTWMHFALNYLEYPIDSESTHTPLERKRRYVRSRRWPALGFGFALSLTCLIPFLNFFLVPVGVVGATLLYQAYGEMEGID